MMPPSEVLITIAVEEAEVGRRTGTRSGAQAMMAEPSGMMRMPRDRDAWVPVV
jgi:hypothetical protein